MKTKICRQCNKEYPNTREFFKRKKMNNGKEILVDVCKQCELKNRYENEWKDGKLKCRICGQYFEEDNFDVNSKLKSRNGRDRRCKKCKYETLKIFKKNLSGEDALNHILSMRLNSIKERSKKKGWETFIELKDLENLYYKQNGLCALSKIKMTYDILDGRTPTNLSIDRIDTNKSYTIDNIQMVCMAVNQMKSDLNMDQLLYFCKLIIKNNNQLLKEES